MTLPRNSSMPYYLVSALALLMLAGSPQTEAREADAHVHGHGLISLVVEGQTLMIELEIPGMDIVGFEHEAKSKADQAAVKAAKVKLTKPGNIFALTEAAGCKTVDTKVSTGEEHEEHEHEDKDKSDDHKDEHKENHMEFRASYHFTCSNPSALSSISLKLFSQFPSLEEIDVQAVTAKGQTKAEATKQNSVVQF